MAYTAYYLSPDRRLAGDVDDSYIRSILESESGVLWVDFTEPDDGDRDLLLNIFGFHPLTVDAVLDQAPQTVRVEDFGRYVFINAQSVDYTLDEDVLQTADLGVFLTLAEPTRAMQREAAAAGFASTAAHGRLPRIQLVTVEAGAVYKFGDGFRSRRVQYQGVSPVAQ